jgi:hypothetical protein
MARSPAVDLGIPDDVARVLVLAESSHWPPTARRGAKESYERLVRPILDRVLDALRADPARVFSIESLFFLDAYWEDRPERRGEIVELANSGRLRLLGGGITVPDTCVPDTEAILRDYLLGQRWLESRDITQRADVCYFPGNAGASPCLPELLRAAGFGAVAWSRLDGMYVRGGDYRPATDYPLPGSNAARLIEQQSIDFVWRSGSREVLAHWNAFLHGQGDLLAAARWGVFHDRSASGVASRVDAEVARLRPLARTRFLFCPIGGDFHAPIHDLRALVARYDAERFPETGTWVVLGGLDDYFALLEGERDKLPILELDPNPVWMGSLASRGELKARCRRLTRALVASEAESAIGEPRDHARAWWRAVATNHEGFVSGTAPARIVESEHEPWLREAEQQLGLASGDRFPDAADASGPSVTAECTEGTWIVDNGVLEIRIEPAKGGLATVSDRDGHHAILDLLSFADTGGPARMGHELVGGTFELVDRASTRPAAVSVTLQPRGWARVSIGVVFERHLVVRTLELHAGDDAVWVGVRGSIARWRTVVLEVGPLPRGGLDMDVPGGHIRRPAVRGADPTFWRARRTVVPEGGSFQVSSDDGLAVARIGDALTWVGLRNAPLERARGFLPVPGHRAWGPDDAVSSTRAMLRFGPPPAKEHVLGGFRATGGELLAVKRAEDGRGVVARIEIERGLAHLVAPWPVATAWRCDARERDLAPLEVTGDDFVFRSADGRIQTVRLLPR